MLSVDARLEAVIFLFSEKLHFICWTSDFQDACGINGSIVYCDKRNVQKSNENYIVAMHRPRANAHWLYSLARSRMRNQFFRRVAMWMLERDRGIEVYISYGWFIATFKSIRPMHIVYCFVWSSIAFWVQRTFNAIWALLELVYFLFGIEYFTWFWVQTFSLLLF